MLSVEGIAARYGESQALQSVSLYVGAGEVVTLLGRNGTGKTTTLRAIMGLLPSVGGRLTAGRILLDGQPIEALAPHRVARLGLGLVPEGRQVFPTLTVDENLTATARPGVGGAVRWSLPSIFALFPRLAERRRHFARQLSGGEQQMLAIGRALMTQPRLLILDEATEGLAPLIRAEIWAVLRRLQAEGQAVLLVDKTLSAVLRLADRHVLLERGQSVWTGSSAEFQANPTLRNGRLAV
jgi:branched-chain amino acid transport system ATP-binding protein